MPEPVPSEVALPLAIHALDAALRATNAESALRFALADVAAKRKVVEEVSKNLSSMASDHREYGRPETARRLELLEEMLAGAL